MNKHTTYLINKALKILTRQHPMVYPPSLSPTLTLLPPHIQIWVSLLQSLWLVLSFYIALYINFRHSVSLSWILSFEKTKIEKKSLPDETSN